MKKVCIRIVRADFGMKKIELQSTLYTLNYVSGPLNFDGDCC
jgi:hypothetical protein